MGGALKFITENAGGLSQGTGFLGNFLGGKAGDILGSVGTGLSVGSMFPGLGTVIGGAGGLALGLGKALLGGGFDKTVEEEKPVVPINRVPGTTGVTGQGYYKAGGPINPGLKHSPTPAPIPKRNQMPSGKYEVVDFIMPQFEVERGEVVQGEDVQLMDGKRIGPGLFEVRGKTHKNGGVPGASGYGRVFTNRFGPQRKRIKR